MLCLEIFYLAWKMNNPGIPSYNPDTLPVAQRASSFNPDYIDTLPVAQPVTGAKFDFAGAKKMVKASAPDAHVQTVQTQRTRRAIAIVAGVIIVGALGVAIYFIVTKPKNVAYSLCTNQNKACCNPETGVFVVPYC